MEVKSQERSGRWGGTGSGARGGVVRSLPGRWVGEVRLQTLAQELEMPVRGIEVPEGEGQPGPAAGGQNGGG